MSSLLILLTKEVDLEIRLVPPLQLHLTPRLLDSETLD